jgi:hypothetical protein
MTEIETLAECIKIYDQIIKQELEIYGTANPTIYFVKEQIEKKIEMLFRQ